ncbi:ABC transporter substrate-binding protein [Streptosporangium sp. NPDC002721]|uniref:ABC transporter substrate-binding protein n=1 Tax=Streptosporangium sp. NPDC002721 TaxID=3366188 RepID=UPI0036CA084C
MTITRRLALMLGAALSVSLVTTACAPSGDGGSGAAAPAQSASATDLQAALDAGGSITIWAWEPTLKQVVTDFQAKYPKVKVNLVNAGTGNDHYTALQNVIKAGSGVPDIAQIEYFALPQFVLAKSVANLTGFGADKLEGTFTPGPWNSVRSGGGIYGMPMDSGPMALFYNKEVFDKHKIEVPATWEEYIEAARKLNAADPKAYITSDTGDPGFVTSMIWQAGGKPYKVEGTTVSVNFADAGTQKFTSAWQTLVSDKLLAPVNGWTDAWYKGLGDGTIASLVIGAWMPANLETGVKAGFGKWRVAPMPQWESGGKATSESGGSSLAIPEASANKALAYAFLKYAGVDEGVQTRLDGGAFPATTAELASKTFQDKKFPYFGDQPVNQILAESAGQVVDGWSYLPYQVYANRIFNDTAGKAYISGVTLQEGLKAWQDASVTYGREQGFTVQ